MLLHADFPHIVGYSADMALKEVLSCPHDIFRPAFREEHCINVCYDLTRKAYNNRILNFLAQWVRGFSFGNKAVNYITFIAQLCKRIPSSTAHSVLLHERLLIVR